MPVCSNCGVNYDRSAAFATCSSCLRLRKAARDADRREKEREQERSKNQSALDDDRAKNERFKQIREASDEQDRRQRNFTAHQDDIRRGFQRASALCAGGLFDDAIRLTLPYIEAFQDDPNGYMRLLQIGIQSRKPDLVAYAGSAFTDFVRRTMNDYAYEMFQEPLRPQLIDGIERLRAHKVTGADQLLRDFFALSPKDPLIPLAIAFAETQQSISDQDLEEHFSVSEVRSWGLGRELRSRNIVDLRGLVLSYRPAAADPAQGPYAQLNSVAYVSESVQKKLRWGYIKLILGLCFIAALYWFAKSH